MEYEYLWDAVKRERPSRDAVKNVKSAPKGNGTLSVQREGLAGGSVGTYL
jgi:hypothetical protein